MSRLFDSSSSEKLLAEFSPPAYPFVLACFFNVTNTTAMHTLMSVADKDATHYYSLAANGDLTGDPVTARSYDGTIHDAKTSTSYSADTWHHACAIMASDIDRRAFIDGGSEGSGTWPDTCPNLDNIKIGVTADSSPFGYTDGTIAEAALYDLSAWPGATDSDKGDNFEKILLSLAAGFAPSHFPLGLVAYWPLVRGLNDKVGGHNLTATGTVVAAHPRVILPQGVR